MPPALDEAERRARRRRLTIILIVAGLLVAGLATFGQLRDSAFDNKSRAALGDLRPQWRETDLAGLELAYGRAAFDAQQSGDLSEVIELFPASNDATFVTANFDNSGAVVARYSIATWAGTECLDVVARPPTPNRVTFSTRAGC